MNKHKHFIIWAFVLLGSAIVEFAFGPVEEYLLRLTPISIWKLPPKAWKAILATLIASLVAWFSALAVGGVLGLFTASGELAKLNQGFIYKAWSSIANAGRRLYGYLYVVPLVLTLSVIGTVLLKLSNKHIISEITVAVCLVVSSGVALAGQRIFIAIDDAVRSASSDDLYLARSLFLGAENNRSKPFVEFIRICREAKFLLSCKISLLTQSVEQAFHLSVVGVVILETIAGILIYEKFFPQEGGVLPWGGGIGRIIVDGQNSTNPELVAGAVWLILIIDSFIAWGIREWLYRRWVTPYRSSQI